MSPTPHQSRLIRYTTESATRPTRLAVREGPGPDRDSSGQSPGARPVPLDGQLLARSPHSYQSATRAVGPAVPDPRAQLAGAAAKRSGRAFELEIEEANRWYEQHGLAVVYRHHPPVEGWGRSLRVVGRGPADFSGVVRLPDGGAVAVAFDCKVITGEASYAHAERDRHQVESLLRFRAAGGLAFLLLRCRALERVWLLADLDALWRRERVRVRGRVSLSDAHGGSCALRHMLPVLEPSPLADVARGVRPYWDYLRLLAQAS